MANVQISGENRKRVYEILAAILHLGNINFQDTNGKCEITDQSIHHFKYAAKLLKINQTNLELVLLTRNIDINGRDPIR